MNRALLFWLAILLTFAGGFTLWFGARGLVPAGDTGSATQVELPTHSLAAERLSEFTLTNQVGDEFHSQELAGQVWAGSFFFSRCPQICVMQNNQVAKLQQEFAERGLKLVSITVDPGYDQPHRLAAYAQRFNADPRHWQFLTGDLDYIRRIGQDKFQVAVEEETHSDRVVVFDRQGQIRGAFRATTPDGFKNLVDLIGSLLTEQTTATKDDQPPPSDGEIDTQA